MVERTAVRTNGTPAFRCDRASDVLSRLLLSCSRERKVQKALVRWKAPESYRFVIEGLEAAGRDDLISRFKSHPAVRAGRSGQGGPRRGRRGAGRGRGRGAAPAQAQGAEPSMDLDTCG